MALVAALFDSGAVPRTVPPAYVQECGSCHAAYPPGMLPARSWQRVMGGLDRHYGSDASLDAPTSRVSTLGLPWTHSGPVGSSTGVNHAPVESCTTPGATW